MCDMAPLSVSILVYMLSTKGTTLYFSLQLE